MSQFTLPNNLIVYGPDANCTLDLCPVEYSVYTYRASRPANATFLALFALALLIQVALGIRYRTWFFMGATILGNVTEIIGYAGRLMLWQNPFSFNGFLMQIVCITFAPAFFSAAIYVTISNIIQFLNPGLSRLPPRLYYYIFIPLDLVSLILQAVGGGLSSTSTGTSQPAIDVAIAGLAFQVFTLVVFISLSMDYAVRYFRAMGYSKSIFDAKFKTFLVFLSLAIVTILIRCIYRIYELKDGYSGPGIRDEGLFIALESVMIVVATFSLCIAHPGVMLRLDGPIVEKVDEETKQTNPATA